MTRALLALEDGRTFWGRAVGARGERAGEVVFNTSMTGYAEILTDPSYRGQLVTLTASHIGNYGIDEVDLEAAMPWAEALIVRSFTERPSNWRSRESLSELLARRGVMAVADLDTRALTRHIRAAGAMRAVLSTEDLDPASLVAKAQAIPVMEGRDLASDVGTQSIYEWNEGTPADFTTLQLAIPEQLHNRHVVVYDFGVKRNTLRRLVDLGCKVTVVPNRTSAEATLALKPDGILISNGPGDPATLEYAVETIRQLIGNVPVFGICLGHQLIGQALGGTTFKLPFGHHAGNHPVCDTSTGKVRITAQNHGFALDPASLPSDVQVTEVSGNDQTCEGLQHKSLPVFSVQYHPEAGPGPHDGDEHFRRFISLVDQQRS
ncbi:MAG TPA: carbamoyl-phosphate synthase small subunit [Herpetosiphon sp.]|uniref:Carbamoyl phosphate synthase small chain n=1 Tax=Herpetosiphon aurantiacus (strain ATCC 23779 / DSM 785 / 114-95) TaxID=316274 RepID=A9AXF4_HERA2|nr:glutamine-hydrolyzing carbamoyl-phosphate synthase small subunit [Herpetosiphon sp.]ABX06874.1 carbamoyl-phosphate synthase, small subunit [Herpetosiphon aurantiacus DSM 785]HBW52776.1 carbamoyl-phosphate synthase small subunit [Herpetosiphon sp.]